ncbi:hypothetical protein F0562_029026 [Nyssa sinensis]|uniref:BHLH domain-containing protein n=1 Tax=Nyssa sinensis TaxID=561372 RepID=A0A5J5B1R3_9ASTE|nr:hypothetical protein F0562_029026 [Nyssa sinensis]
MSFPPFENPHYEDNNFLYPLDDSYNSWPLLLQESRMLPPSTDHNLLSEPIDSIAEAAPQPSVSVDKGLSGNRLNSQTSERNSQIKHLQAQKMVSQHGAEEEGSTAKKQKLDHNAKERVRRMKLNASYLALRSLLPNSRRSKKKWSAPAMIDRVLEYIPELEKEIEKLTLKKTNMQSINQNPQLELQSPTVSVSEVKNGEVIFQICMGRDGNHVFSNLIQKVEEEGMCIASASTLYACEDRVCYHLHIQVYF